MATAKTVTKSYSDDLTGEKLNASQRVAIVLTDGRHTWTVDTARAADVVTLLKGAGEKQKVRGRKPGSTNSAAAPSTG